VGDVNNRIHYFSTYDNYDIRKIDLNEIDFEKAEFKANAVYGTAGYRAYEIRFLCRVWLNGEHRTATCRLARPVCIKKASPTSLQKQCRRVNQDR
jgi:hypothetical protein